MYKKLQPKISIIIPVYNGSNYLREAIDSALAQTYKNLEIIVINDGSTDNGATEKIAKAYGGRIRYYAKKNGGVATALNMGIKKSKGEYISWLSHDDIYEPDKVLLEFNELRGLKDSVVYSSYTCIDGGNNFLYKVDLEEVHGPTNLSNGFYAVFQGCLNGCTLMLPRSIFEKIGYFNESLHYTQDYDFWNRLALGGIRFIFINDFLVKSRVHKNQNSLTAPKNQEECDNLWIRLVGEISEKEIIQSFGSRLNFLKIVKSLADGNGYRKVSDHLTDLVIKETKKSLQIYRDKPLVTIIIPCLNQGQYLKKAIESSLNQFYQKIEIIVINDGSNDKTDYVAKEFEKKGLVKYLKHENKGVSYSRNLALKKSKGDFIQFLDADDLLTPDKIHRQINYYSANPEVDVQYCDFKYYNVEDGTEIEASPASLDLKTRCPYDDLLFRWQRPISIPIHSFLFKKECFHNREFPDALKVGEDWYTWVSIAYDKKIFAHNNFIGAIYQIHGDGRSRKDPTTFFESIKTVERIRNDFVRSNIIKKFDNEIAKYIEILVDYHLKNNNTVKTAPGANNSIKGKIKFAFKSVIRLLPWSIRSVLLLAFKRLIKRPRFVI
jgi:glycosyltransferase involved in cell wall biosynthesis